jgi:hypothetical protein
MFGIFNFIAQRKANRAANKQLLKNLLWDKREDAFAAKYRRGEVSHY